MMFQLRVSCPELVHNKYVRWKAGIFGNEELSPDSKRFLCVE